MEGYETAKTNQVDEPVELNIPKVTWLMELARDWLNPSLQHSKV